MWQRSRRTVYLMLFGGLLISEAAALRWRDVDLEAGELMVVDGRALRLELLSPMGPLSLDLLPVAADTFPISTPPYRGVPVEFKADAEGTLVTLNGFEIARRPAQQWRARHRTMGGEATPRRLFLPPLLRWRGVCWATRRTGGAYDNLRDAGRPAVRDAGAAAARARSVQPRACRRLQLREAGGDGA